MWACACNCANSRPRRGHRSSLRRRERSAALSRACLGEVGEDLRVPAPGQAKKVAMLGSLDHLTRQLIVHDPTDKRSSDFIVHLEQLDRLYGPQPGRQAKPVVLVRSTTANARSPRWRLARTGSPSSGCGNTRPNSTTSSRSGATSRPITSPTRPSPTPSRSTTPSTTPSQISTASGSLIRWPNWESLLRNQATEGKSSQALPGPDVFSSIRN